MKAMKYVLFVIAAASIGYVAYSCSGWANLVLG
jgi:hypothetical protein